MRNHAGYRCLIFENIDLIILFGDPRAVIIEENENITVTVEATKILKAAGMSTVLANK